ncbi:hypothetical protein PR202_ga31089 [Eleusine coracana subsp. coracana]|uniref:ABC transporter domain-containing protein n=1 Tax=Eleusine coracana subsp. coracana TaxID=191504 RepID=A0AAV5DP51_ELECO|nr:hypothetical protein PR202_ga31089 [Eleusine coracana subsp. coracana]
MDVAVEIQKVASMRRGDSGSMWRRTDDVFSRSSISREEDDEEALRWAALEKLPTYDRVRRAIVSHGLGGDDGTDAVPKGVVDVDILSLGPRERRALLERLVRDADEDNEQFLRKLKDRIERVGIDMPTIEVRFEHVNAEAEVRVGSSGLPTILNSVVNTVEEAANALHILPSRKQTMPVLHDVSGIIRPRRMTLLLGPPGSGKTTLLLALAGRLGNDLKVTGKVTYNGHEMTEFVPQRTAAYISQNDLHIGEMTVRETLEFSARCQGVGSRFDMLTELSRREKAANIKPDADIDAFMKATEMLVGPARALFMDEISTGLDSSTTFQIVNSLKQSVHILGGTVVISLLQPAPETYNLFDDIILISDGQIVYQGPREEVVEYFDSMGFRCPERKGVADFLQEVTSKKDQKQYWARHDEPYRRIAKDLAVPFDKTKSHPAALTATRYGVSNKELLKANINREILLMKRNSFVYIFRIFQLLLTSIIAMTLFFRTKMKHDSVADGGVYMSALFFGVLMIMFNGFTEISLTIAKLPVFFKQRDLLFFPAWSYTIPSWILKIPITFIEVGGYAFMTYYVIGFDPSVTRFFKHYLLLLAVNQMSSALFRFLGGAARNMIVASVFGSFTLLLVMVLGGFILVRAYGNSRPSVSEEELKEKHANVNGEVLDDSHMAAESSSGINIETESAMVEDESTPTRKGMILPFAPLSLSFDNIRYSVDMPQEMKARGVGDERLELLKGVSGSFRPGVLTALMGVSGAGKTTLMDVLAGRKTAGYIDGDINISGYPKKQETFARVSGYCEQNDIHSPQVTVYESLLFSAWLRLPRDVDSNTRQIA